MKRLIKDILTEQGYIKDDVLSYIIEKDGKLYSKRKNVVDSNLEIETVVDSTPMYDRPAVGLSYSINRFYEDVVEVKKKDVWIGILQRLLIDNLNPLGVVHIWTEEKEGFVYVHGRCLVKNNKANCLF